MIIAVFFFLFLNFVVDLNHAFYSHSAEMFGLFVLDLYDFFDGIKSGPLL